MCLSSVQFDSPGAPDPPYTDALEQKLILQGELIMKNALSSNKNSIAGKFSRRKFTANQIR
jgi:hypothetical protein